MTTGSKKELIVVGSGIIGLSTAYFALERGWNVKVVDRIEEGGDNCSVGNAGMIVPSHFIPIAAPGAMGQAIRWMFDPESPFSLKPSLSLEMLKWGIRFMLASTETQANHAAPLLRDLNMASRELYLKWAESGLEFGLAKKGLLMLCATSEVLNHEMMLAQQSRDLGIPAQVLSAEETAALDPNITMNVVGSVYYPKDCHLTPSILLTSLREKIRSMGGEFIWNRHITGWRMRGQKISAIQTVDGDIPGDEFALCAGVWSSSLVKGLRLKIPMLAGKGYSLTLPTPIELPSVCSILCEAKVAVTPMGDSLRMGGTMTVGNPDHVVDKEKLSGIINGVGRFFPRFKPQHFDGIQPWVGLRPVTPDGLPYIGKSHLFTNLTVATGHAMMGLSLGPITGQLISQLLSGDKTSIPIDKLSPDRYGA